MSTNRRARIEDHSQVQIVGATEHRKNIVTKGERSFIPYGRQSIGEDDIQAVIEVLRSDWLTTGPKVVEFERTLAGFVTAGEAVAVNSGTAALHAVMFALGIGPGDEVVLPPMTFAATANAVVFQGGTPVFADVDPETLLIDPSVVADKITLRTKAIVAVDYAGQPCDYDALKAISKDSGVPLIADACHSLGAEYKGKKVGTLTDLTVFSFHPVKHITTGEGGMVVTDRADLAEKMRTFRNHGITADHQEREKLDSWVYEMHYLGYNYRITDFQCALGISQLSKLQAWLDRRRAIAARYDEALADIAGLKPLGLRSDLLPAKSPKRLSLSALRSVPYAQRSSHAYHLYVVQLASEAGAAGRAALFKGLRKAGIGANVHYIPVHFHPFYQKHFGTRSGQCPVAEAAYERIISLPIYPAMTYKDQDVVLEVLRDTLT